MFTDVAVAVGVTALIRILRNHDNDAEDNVDQKMNLYFKNSYSSTISASTEISINITSLFPNKDRLNRSLKSKVDVYKASCWNCDDFQDIGKTKRRLHIRKTEHFKALSKNCQTSAIADHITLTGHNIKWDHFEILAAGRYDIYCRIKESLLIEDLKPSLNENVSSEKLFLY